MRAVFLIAIAGTAAACSCGPESEAPLCQRIDRVKVLFVGTAVETNDIDPGLIGRQVWYRFSVEEPFKGVGPEVKEVLVDPDSMTSCKAGFILGRRYLVYSYADWFDDEREPGRPDGPVVLAGVCTGSRYVEAAAEDLEFIRQYGKTDRPSRIFGSIRIDTGDYYYGERYPPVPGAVVRIYGPGGIFTTTAGLDGNYGIAEAAPGNYVLTVQAPGFHTQRASYILEVPAHGCGVAHIGMFSEGSMRGWVIERDGRPAKGIAVEYYRSNPEIADPRFSQRSTRTDQQGHFEFTQVPPGEFLVGVHISSTPTPGTGIPPTYWPGVTERAKALIVRIAVNEKKDNLVIQLPPR